VLATLDLRIFPNLSVSDYFFLRYLKDPDNPQTIGALKNSIRIEIRKTLHDMLPGRVAKVILRQGG